MEIGNVHRTAIIPYYSRVLKAAAKINPDSPEFSRRLLAWHRLHGRKTLPWQNTRDPYPIWLSEIMLQQTQVETAIPYFLKFLARFPDISTLARSSQDEVMAHWAGLGYYARARNLHKAAGIVDQKHDGVFPDSFEEVVALPGIGRSTAGAILAFSKEQRHPILDGNVKRVLTRVFGIPGYPGTRSVEKQLWELAECLTPHSGVSEYTQGIMDLGATLCRRAKPQCQDCPFNVECVAHNTQSIALYPGKQPAKARPQKSTRMLVLLNQKGEIMLEKRPPRGIWGGLHSLPEVDDPQMDPAAFCLDSLNLQTGVIDQLPVVKHGFTHFDLLVTPVICEVTADSDAVGEELESGWFPRSGLDSVGLPAVVSTILSNLPGPWQSSN